VKTIRLTNFVKKNAITRKGLVGLLKKEQNDRGSKYDDYIKAIPLDGDTKIALSSSAPPDIEQDWYPPRRPEKGGASPPRPDLFIQTVPSRRRHLR
jgi:hypothetical protein